MNRIGGDVVAVRDRIGCRDASLAFGLLTACGFGQVVAGTASPGFGHGGSSGHVSINRHDDSPGERA